MPKGMQPIYTRTLSSTTGSFNFNNIPQTYDDLYLLISGRLASGASYGNVYLQINGITSTVYDTSRMTGNGTGVSCDRIPAGTFFYVGEVNGDVTTSNTFGTCTVYIPGYKSNRFKQILTENASENNSSAAFVGLHSCLFRANVPVTTINISGGGNFLSGTTFTLYGIGR